MNLGLFDWLTVATVVAGVLGAMKLEQEERRRSDDAERDDR